MFRVLMHELINDIARHTLALKRVGIQRSFRVQNDRSLVKSTPLIWRRLANGTHEKPLPPISLPFSTTSHLGPPPFPTPYSSYSPPPSPKCPPQPPYPSTCPAPPTPHSTSPPAHSPPPSPTPSPSPAHPPPSTRHRPPAHAGTDPAHSATCSS